MDGGGGFIEDCLDERRKVFGAEAVLETEAVCEEEEQEAEEQRRRPG